jgi:hypothetical protein
LIKAQPDKKYMKSVADFFFNLLVRKKRKAPNSTGGACEVSNLH